MAPFSSSHGALVSRNRLVPPHLVPLLLDGALYSFLRPSGQVPLLSVYLLSQTRHLKRHSASNVIKFGVNLGSHIKNIYRAPKRPGAGRPYSWAPTIILGKLHPCPYVWLTLS